MTPRPAAPARADRAFCARVARFSILSLALTGPLLLFPAGPLPFLALAIALFVAACRRAHAGALRLEARDVPLLYLAGMGALGLWVSFDRALSWPRAWSFVFGLLVYVEVRRFLGRAEHRRWAAPGLLALTFGLAAVSLVGTDWSAVRLAELPALYGALPSLLPALPASGAAAAAALFNPRWVGITMGVLAPACLALLRDRRAPVRFAAGAAFLAATALLLLTQSPQGLLGWAAGSFIVLVIADRRALWLLPAGAFALAAALLLLDTPALARRLLDVQDPFGAAVVLRVDIWSRALAMLRDLPFTGGGLNTFAPLQQQFYPGFLLGREAHAHSLYLQTALDFGLPGLAAFLGFTAVWASGALRALRRADSPGEKALIAAALGGIAAYLAHGLLDGMMLGAKPGFVVWALFGLGAALAGGERRTPGAPARAAAWLAVPAFTLLLFAVFPAAFWRNVGALEAHRLLSPFPAAALSGDPAGARVALQRSLGLDARSRQANLLLGRLAAAEGRYAEAAWHYEQVVVIDLNDPYGRYYPPAVWLRALQAEPAPAPDSDLARIYTHWANRYPGRAENVLLRSLLAELAGAPETARNLLADGLARAAQPAGLLEHALEAPPGPRP